MKKKLLITCILFSHLLNAQTLLTSMPETDDDVNAIFRSGNTVYIGGEFLNFNASPKKYLASFDALTGTVNSWNPEPNGEVHALAVAGGKLIVGGAFDTISLQPRNGICMYDLATGALDSWVPTTNQNVYAIAVYNNTFYYVGYSSGFKVFCVDAVTGNYTGWESQQMIGFMFTALLRSGNYVYVGGEIDQVTIYNIRNLCRFDAATGLVDTSFHPANLLPSSDWITSLAEVGSNVYVGGSYTIIGGQNRNGIASFYPSGGITPFNPYCSNHQIYSLFSSGSYIWLGGNSYVLGGYNRPRIAEINTATQYATCWDPSSISSGWLWTISIFTMGDTVYAGSLNPSVGNRHFNVIINSPRPHPDSITGPAVVNQFQSAAYSIPFQSGHTYYWNVTGGTGSSTTNSINVTWGAGPAGTVTVVESNPVSTNCYSDTLTLNVTIQLSTAIHAGQSNHLVSMMPNPGNGNITLQAEAFLYPPFSVSVYDISGQLIFYENETKPRQDFPLDLTSQKAGIYFVEVKNSRTVTTGKLVKE